MQGGPYRCKTSDAVELSSAFGIVQFNLKPTIDTEQDRE